MSPKREHNIQNEIRAWCGEHNIWCFRCNVGKVQCIDGTWFDTGLPEGFPDLLVLPGNNIVICCEVKAKYGKQRDAQINFQKEAESRGYTYVLARSVDDVKKTLDNLGII